MLWPAESASFGHMPSLTILPDGRTIAIAPQETILAAAIKAGISHAHACGGAARCSTCRVWILEGIDACAPRTPREAELAERLGFDAALRLACQTQVAGDVTLRRLVLDEADLDITNQLKRRPSGRVGVAKDVVVMFCDIRGFTSFSASLSAYDVMFVLNRFFRQAGASIEEMDGSIDNFIGDAVMALFGIDGDPEAPVKAVAAALRMLEGVDRLKPYMEAMYGQSFDVGIGLHYGEAVIGSLGTGKAEKLTAIGDTVNIASRIEAANKESGTRLLISEELYARTKDEIVVADFIRTKLRGTNERKTLYEVKALTPATNERLSRSPDRAGAATSRFGGQDWEPVLDEAELPPGSRKVVERDRFDILLIRTEKDLFALNNACPHLNLPFNDSLLTEDQTGIVCRWHQSCFDLVSGRIRAWCAGLDEHGLSKTQPQLGRLNKNHREMVPLPARIADGKVWVALG